MSHWAHEHYDALEEAISETEWSIDKPSSDKGPVVFNHSDGSEISFVNSSISGGFALEYQPENDDVDIFKDKHQSFRNLGNAVEMAEHILTRHQNRNY